MIERRVTLADVAREAKVHVTTVSMAMRNHARLPECTRRRIQTIALRLGYRPDPMLRALAAYRTAARKARNPPTLAYVTNWSTRWGWKEVTAHPDFFSGAQAKADEIGFRLDHFWMREPGMTDDRLSRIFDSRAINGLVIASHMREIDTALHFDWRRFSAVKIDYFPHQPELHNVTNDQCGIIRLAMRRVIAGGHRRIGFVMHRGWNHSAEHLWTAGFLCEQENLARKDRIPALLFPDLEPVANWINEGKGDVVPDYEPFARWVERYRPEVIISKASFVLPLLARLRLSVPRQIRFVDVFLADTSGRVAGVRQNHATVGALAVEILAGQLQHTKFGVPEIPTTTFVEGTWFDGASCPPRA